MKKRSLISTLFCVLLLAGCHHHRHGSTEHCPPGQAKKGNCEHHCPPGQAKKGKC